MADITMCKGEGCPNKDKCYRHLAPQNEYRQSWFVTSPIQEGVCTYFVDTSRENPDAN